MRIAGCVFFAMFLFWNSSMAATPVLVIHGGAGVDPQGPDAREGKARARRSRGRAARRLRGAQERRQQPRRGRRSDRRARGLAALQRRQGRGVHARRHATSSTRRSWTARRCAPARSPACIACKNPILLARAVMEKSPHVMLVGDGAEAFATQRRHRARRPVVLPHRGALAAAAGGAEGRRSERRRSHARTTQCTSAPSARSRSTAQGQLAAATSTGGMTNKRWGRVGDSPIIGAGTYANAHCAVSATGWGEFFIRATVAHDICARVEYAGRPVARGSEDGRAWTSSRSSAATAA